MTDDYTPDMLEVLMFMFENYMQNDTHTPQGYDVLLAGLKDAGFEQPEIDKAFDWLESLLKIRKNFSVAVQQPSTMRVFTPYESHRIDVKCRDFLLFLERAGILNSMTRELVIDGLMNLDSDYISLSEVKWVALMVLFNEPEDKQALAAMETLVLDEMTGGMH